MSFKYKLVPEGVYNQIVNRESTSNILKSNLPDEAKILLYQEKIRNLNQQRLNRENKPIIVGDPTLQSKIEQVLRLLKSDDALPEVQKVEEAQNIGEQDNLSDLDETVEMDNDEFEQDEPKRPLKRKQAPLGRPNKKLLLERKEPINYEQEMQEELKDRITSIRKRDPAQYRFKPDYRPVRPKYTIPLINQNKRKIPRDDWNEYVESGIGPKATLLDPPPLNIPKLKLKRLDSDKRVINKRLHKDDTDEPIPKRSQRLLNRKLIWSKYKY
jgi:hypothetical protein